MDKLTSDEALDMFCSTLINDEYQDIEDGCRVSLGLLIIFKYIDPKKNIILIDAVGDSVGSVYLTDLIDSGATREDVKELIRLGWFISLGQLHCYL